MDTHVCAARGAISIDGEEEGLSMVNAVGQLMDCLAQANQFTVQDMISLQFTQTTDLTEKNAAAALRQSRPEYGSVPLFCASEPEVKGSAPRMVRVLVMYRGEQRNTQPVYLGRARSLRPDLEENS
ncbi:MAG: chorismate mutase [Spirochaetales bacterium]|nr:chorismate mutase [Spirochaetales bacterium]